MQINLFCTFCVVVQSYNLLQSREQLLVTAGNADIPRPVLSFPTGSLILIPKYTARIRNLPDLPRPEDDSFSQCGQKQVQGMLENIARIILGKG